MNSSNDNNNQDQQMKDIIKDPNQMDQFLQLAMSSQGTTNQQWQNLFYLNQIKQAQKDIAANSSGNNSDNLITEEILEKRRQFLEEQKGIEDKIKQKPQKSIIDNKLELTINFQDIINKLPTEITNHCTEDTMNKTAESPELKAFFEKIENKFSRYKTIKIGGKEYSVPDLTYNSFLQEYYSLNNEEKMKCLITLRETIQNFQKPYYTLDNAIGSLDALSDHTGLQKVLYVLFFFLYIPLREIHMFFFDKDGDREQDKEEIQEWKQITQSIIRKLNQFNALTSEKSEKQIRQLLFTRPEFYAYHLPIKVPIEKKEELTDLGLQIIPDIIPESELPLRDAEMGLMFRILSKRFTYSELSNQFSKENNPTLKQKLQNLLHCFYDQSTYQEKQIFKDFKYPKILENMQNQICFACSATLAQKIAMDIITGHLNDLISNCEKVQKNLSEKDKEDISKFIIEFLRERMKEFSNTPKDTITEAEQQKLLIIFKNQNQIDPKTLQCIIDKFQVKQKEKKGQQEIDFNQQMAQLKIYNEGQYCYEKLYKDLYPQYKTLEEGYLNQSSPFGSQQKQKQKQQELL